MVLARCQASGVATFRAEQFSVSVSDEVLADLRARIGTPGGQARRQARGGSRAQTSVTCAACWNTGRTASTGAHRNAG